MARVSYRASWANYVFFWIPMGVSADNPRFDASVWVDSVLKGDDKPEQIPLTNYRPLTREESALIPYGHPIHDGLRLRVGYNRLRADSVTGLTLVPLGNTPEFEEALRRWPKATTRAEVPAQPKAIQET